MGNLLEIREMRVQERRADSGKVGVARVVDLNETPWVLPGTDLLAVDLNDILASDDGEGHEAAELGVLLDGVLVVLLNVVGEVVDGDAVVLNVLHDELFRLGELCGGEGIGLADDGDKIAHGREALHELNVEFPEAISC